MVDPEYALVWPRPLFDWEARRVVALEDDDVPSAAVLLLEEAFHDPGVSLALVQEIGPTEPPWIRVGDPDRVRAWLSSVLADERKLRPYTPPKYYAERNHQTELGEYTERRPLANDVLALIDELQDRGYFPSVLPRECVDDPTDYEFASRAIQDATHISVSWPIEGVEREWLPEAALYSIIEFFHDQAQRPRTRSMHTFSGCGPHYSAPNRQAGGVVYRWRMNEVLKRHEIALRLGSKGEERGRLIQHFGLGLDSLAESLVDAPAGEPANEVAEGVRMYRERGASVAQKRAALHLLAGALEPRRKAISAVVLKKDESHLFEIANNYAIRHRNADQRTDVGEPFLDWVFWNFVSMIDLMNRIEQRE
ncbi:hypothetical protein [Amnibacterium sp.]|uniref:hypothetical protein n=1 Tax=Amnibacterium sp. TaxID=1872496 RepID=UPI003F7BCF73